MLQSPVSVPGARPNDCRLLAALAAIHCHYGRLERARCFLNLSLWIDPGHVPTLRVAAVVALRELRADLCLKYLDRLEPIHNAELVAMRTRAQAMRARAVASR